MKTNEFVLPEKWKVKWNEEVGKYYAEKSDKVYLSSWNYLKNINNSNQKITDDAIEMDASFSAYSYCDWEEITFDQFKEHVLKEIYKPEYDLKDVAFKPVGYKFKYPKLKNVVTAILGDIEVYKTDSYDFPLKSSVCQELKELQVLDLWCDKVMFENESEFNSENEWTIGTALNEFEKKCGENFNQRKVIGYKLINPEYKEAVSKIIDLTLGDFETTERFPFNFSPDSEWCFELKEMKVLDLFFEPVYDNSITLKSGVKLSEDDIAEVKEILKNK